MKAVSLFSGIGGFELAMQRAGIEVIASCEIDDKARKLLEARFPLVNHYKDIRDLTGQQLEKDGFNGADGIITAGFPCQDLSVAGLRKGLAGARSGLFWEIIRLADELRPKTIILENVPGLLSSQRGKDMGIVITALVERGYGVAWRVLDSQNFGVPQRRRRVFIVASLGDHRKPIEILFEPESLSGYFKSNPKKRKNAARRLDESVDNTSTELNESIYHPHQHDGVRVVKNQTNTLTSYMGTGGNNVPFLAYPFHGGMVGRKLENGPSGTGFKDANESSFTLTASTQSIHGVVINDNPVLLRNREGKAGGGKGPLLSEDKSLTIATNNDQTLFSKNVVRRLTPMECERLQGFPDGWTAGQADSVRYKQLGNAVSVPVVEWLLKRVL
jgi:DNA (cytosine-5)-methyltransferase 1